MNRETYDDQFKEFILRSDSRFDRWEMPSHRIPVLNEDTQTTEFSYTYVMHTGWAARILARTMPDAHVDISSYIYFAAIASAIVPTEFYDIRPANIPLYNLYCGKADLVNLSFGDNSLVSLSCMHVLEHIGLGRYGDTLDPQGDLKAAAELQRVLKSGGQLLMVLPMSNSPRVCFNAHRVYSYQQVLDMFPLLKSEEFSLFVDQRKIIKNPDRAVINSISPGIDYTGMFLLRKP